MTTVTVCNACAKGQNVIRTLDYLRGIKCCGHRDGNGYVIRVADDHAR